MHIRMILLLCPFILSEIVVGQINVGSSFNPGYKDPGEISKHAMDELTETTTLFFLKQGDDDWQDELQSKLNEVWTITPIKVIPYEERNDAFSDKSKRYSVFNLSAIKLTYGEVKNIYAFLTLSMNTSYEGKDTTLYFARIELHPTAPTLQKMLKLESFEYTVGSFLYSEGKFENWCPGILVNSLQNINNSLSNGVIQSMYKSIKNENLLSQLNTGTLYVLDHVRYEYDAFQGVDKERKDVSKLFSNYPNKYQLITCKELSEMITVGHEPFLYMVYTKSSSSKFLTVFKSDTGEIAFADYVGIGYNLKSKDIGALASAIKRSK